MKEILNDLIIFAGKIGSIISMDTNNEYISMQVKSKRDDTVGRKVMKQNHKIRNLSKAREAAGLSQQDLANIMGVPRGYITYWENGQREPKIEQIIKLSEVLNVSSDYILGISDVKSLDLNIQTIYDFYITKKEEKKDA